MSRTAVLTSWLHHLFCRIDTHTHNRLTAFCLGLPWGRGYQKKHSVTRTHHDHQTSVSTCSTIHSVLLVQIACLTVCFHNLSPDFFPLGLGPSTSYSIHFCRIQWNIFSTTFSLHNVSSSLRYGLRTVKKVAHSQLPSVGCRN